MPAYYEGEGEELQAWDEAKRRVGAALVTGREELTWKMSRCNQFGNVATPQGPSPALIFLIIVMFARSTTETSFDGPLAVKSVFASGESAMPQGRSPTSTDVLMRLVAVSMTKTLCPRPVLT